MRRCWSSMPRCCGRRTTKSVPCPQATTSGAGSVPAVPHLVASCLARVVVAAVHVTNAPTNLRLRAAPPVVTGRLHLATGQRLRDAVRPASRVVGVHAPRRLEVPQPTQATPLMRVAPPVVLGHAVAEAPRHVGMTFGALVH